MTVATLPRHFSDPTKQVQINSPQVLGSEWQQVSQGGKIRSQAKLIWVIVDCETFRGEVIWGYVSLEKEGVWILGLYITKLESESISSNYMSGNNFDTEVSCTSLNCCLRAQDNVVGTKRAWSPNRQAEMSV